jgi:hypothetical protein
MYGSIFIHVPLSLSAHDIINSIIIIIVEKVVGGVNAHTTQL